MKDSSKYGAVLKRLCTQIKKDSDISGSAEPHDLTAELLLGCLSEHTTESKAVTALGKLESYFVDYNELRVARPDEILEALGKTYPLGKEVAATMTKVLKSVQEKLDCLDLSFLTDGGKREAKAFLEELDGITPYISAWMMLRGLGGHAVPVNEHLVVMLRDEGAIAEDADAADVQGFLERQISASKVLATYALLRHHADNFKEPKLAGKSGTAKAKKTTKTVTKKKVKKTAKKKKAVKKTTKTTKKKS